MFRHVSSLIFLVTTLGIGLYLLLVYCLDSDFTRAHFLNKTETHQVVQDYGYLKEKNKEMKLDSVSLLRTYGYIWPIHNWIDDDRILNQLNFLREFVRENVQNSLSTKIILRIGSFNFNHLMWKNGRQHLIDGKCPITDCHFTANLSYFPLADAVVISEFDYRDLKKFTPKPSHQIWVAQYLEPPHHHYLNSRALNGLVNWTAGYRRDSTIVLPYGKWFPVESSSHCSDAARGTHGNMKCDCSGCGGNCQDVTCTKDRCCCGCSCKNGLCLKCPLCQSVSGSQNVTASPPLNYATGKTKKVAMLTSNCRDINGRRRYAWELSKYIDVDFFGSCGGTVCRKVTPPLPMTFYKNPCFDMLKKDYKFFLSFENSNCAGYITEKLHWNALLNDVVPVVMGARIEDYALSAPPGSYIHVDDFSSPRDLAEYLKLLDSNDTLYNEYFRYKQNYRYVDIHDTKYWCRLCGLLHLQDRVKYVNWYEDFDRWTRGACSKNNDGQNLWKTWKKGSVKMSSIGELIKILDALL